MKQGMTNTVIAAIVGGIVGAGVVFFAGGNSKVDLTNVELESLKVANLTISNQATLLNQEGQPELAIRDGSILANNVIVAKKLVGQQLQGHAIVANRVFTTPDDLMATPMQNWRFFAELGSSVEAGGELVVRSAAGFASVDQPTSGGALLRAGFDTDSRPQMVAIHNVSRSVMPLNFDLSAEQKQMVSGTMPQNPGTFNGTATTPVNTYNPSADTLIPPSTASQNSTSTL